jgi:hypothetical protein
MVWGAAAVSRPQRAGYESQRAENEERRKWEERRASKAAVTAKAPSEGPVISLGFYRKHTESLLRRYLYASMQVGRAPSILGDPIARGWCSSRPIRTFEDAVIFVLDVERCLNRLGSLDRMMLSRIVLQEYTQAEAASLLGMSVRTICYKFPKALDRLTEKLLESGLLVLPG